MFWRMITEKTQSFVRSIKPTRKFNWDFETLQDTIAELEEIQRNEMKAINYNPQGFRLSNIVKADIIPENDRRIITDKYDLQDDILRYALVRGQFSKLMWPYSRYESPFSLEFLSPALASINKYWKDQKLPIRQVVIMGTTSTGSLRPQLRRTTKGGYMVLFNEGIFTLIHCIAKAICVLMPNESDLNAEIVTFDDKIDWEQRLREAVGRFIEVMEVYVTSRDATLSRRYLQEEKYMNYIAAMNQIAPGFMLAHEYGHFFLGHLGDKEKKFTSIGQAGSKLFGRTTKRQHRYEYDADQIALRITLSGHEEITSLASKYIGIEFALNLSEVVQDLTVKNTGSTHPSFEQRLRKLRKSVRRWTKRHDYNRIIKLAEIQRSLFLLLLKEFKVQRKELLN